MAQPFHVFRDELQIKEDHSAVPAPSLEFDPERKRACSNVFKIA